MRNEAVFSAMSFAIAGMQVTCGIEAEALKIKVTPTDSLKPSQLALTRMTADSSSIEFTIAHLPHTTNTASTPFSTQMAVDDYRSTKSKV
jgi:hypothetical protein